MSRPKSDLFAKITTTVTEAKSQIKDIDKGTVVSRSHDMKGHAQTCVERYCDLAHISVDQFLKVSTQCHAIYER